MFSGTATAALTEIAALLRSADASHSPLYEIRSAKKMICAFVDMQIVRKRNEPPVKRQVFYLRTFVRVCSFPKLGVKRLTTLESEVES